MREPLFQRRHYEYMAEQCWRHALSKHTVASLALMFGRDNPKFNRGKFISACRLEERVMHADPALVAAMQLLFDGRDPRDCRLAFLEALPEE